MGNRLNRDKSLLKIALWYLSLGFSSTYKRTCHWGIEAGWNQKMLEQTIKATNKQMCAVKTILFNSPPLEENSVCATLAFDRWQMQMKSFARRRSWQTEIFYQSRQQVKRIKRTHTQGVMKAATLGGKSGQLVQGSALWDCIRGRVADWTIKAQSVSTLCLHLSQVLTCTCLTFDLLTMLAICFPIQ